MKVIITGANHNSEKTNAVSEALEKLDVEILMIDNSPKIDSKEIAMALEMPIYEDPKHLFEKPKSKYHK